MNPTIGHQLGRNEPCHCGSGRKYKQCCLDKDEATTRAAAAEATTPAASAKATTPAAGAEATAEAPAPAAEAPGRTKAPKHQTHQPWKKSAANTHGFHRMSTPRKVGGG